MRSTVRNAIYLGLIVLGGLLLTISVLWMIDDPSAGKCMLTMLLGALLFTISSSFIREATDA